MGEEWEHAVKLETLAARLALLDKELVNAGVKLTDSAVPVPDEEDADAVEEISMTPSTEAEAEPEAVLDFNLDEILDRLVQMVAATAMPETVGVAIPSFEGDSAAIPVTPALLADLKVQVQTTQALAEFGENVLIGAQRQMTLNDLWNAHRLDQALQKKSTPRKKESAASADTVQLTLF